MKKCLYFAENQFFSDTSTSLWVGYGFHSDGMWRKTPIPFEKSGLMIDDRFLPNRVGLTEAIHTLSDWQGLIVLDFERPYSAILADFVFLLAGKRLILPPTYSNAQHEAVIVGPWQGDIGFSDWLSIQKEKYGKIVLDGFPLRVQCSPGGHRLPWNGPLPNPGFPCIGLGCIHRRLSDGSFLYWDTMQTLAARLEAADVPFILFCSDLEALP